MTSNDPGPRPVSLLTVLDRHLTLATGSNARMYRYLAITAAFVLLGLTALSVALLLLGKTPATAWPVLTSVGGSATAAGIAWKARRRGSGGPSR